MNQIERNQKRIAEVASRLRALSHPLRLAIVGALEGCTSMNVTQVCKQFQIIQPEASHHLKILRDAGILVNMRRGQQMHYSIKPGIIKDITNCIEKLG